MMMLSKYGEMNQTKLLSYCGLNLSKHREILDELNRKDLIERKETSRGKKAIVNYKLSAKGLEFCKMILEPYEDMFPRERKKEEES